jgi:lipopolysaccharide transport system ATP-binding protein
LLEVGTGFHPELTGRENIFLNGTILGMTKKEIKNKFDEIVDFSGVEKFIDTPVKRYSSGMYVRLAFSVAAHLDPEILIVDEVLAVGDAEFQKKALGKMKNVSEGNGRTVLFVSHNMAAIQKLCTTALYLKNGLVKEAGDVKQIIDKYMTINTDYIETNLEKLQDRSGNQKAIFSSVYIENLAGEVLKKVYTGENIKIVIKIKIQDKNIKNLNIGFSVHSVFDEMYSYLYTEFENVEIKPGAEDYLTVKFKINKFPFGDRKVFIKGRILADEVECDWPSNALYQIEIEEGNFYKNPPITNKIITPFLIKGEWEVN